MHALALQDREEAERRTATDHLRGRVHRCRRHVAASAPHRAEGPGDRGDDQGDCAKRRSTHAAAEIEQDDTAESDHQPEPFQPTRPIPIERAERGGKQRHAGDRDRRQAGGDGLFGVADQAVAYAKQQGSADGGIAPLQSRRRWHATQAQERVERTAGGEEAHRAKQERRPAVQRHANGQVSRAPDHIHGEQGQWNQQAHAARCRLSGVEAFPGLARIGLVHCSDRHARDSATHKLTMGLP